MNRVLSDLDKFVIDFVKVLDECKIRYVIVGDYIDILLGNISQKEHLEIFIDNYSYEEFLDFWEEVTKEFECMNTDNPKDAYENYIKDGSAVRFFRKGSPFPNMEFKLAMSKHDFESMNNSIKLILSEHQLIISPLEMHIAFKLHLGSEKDFRDARHIYDIFKNNLDLDKLKFLLNQFNNIKKKKVKEYLVGLYE